MISMIIECSNISEPKRIGRMAQVQRLVIDPENPSIFLMNVLLRRITNIQIYPGG